MEYYGGYLFDKREFYFNMIDEKVYVVLVGYFILRILKKFVLIWLGGIVIF